MGEYSICVKGLTDYIHDFDEFSQDNKERFIIKSVFENSLLRNVINEYNDFLEKNFDKKEIYCKLIDTLIYLVDNSSIFNKSEEFIPQ